jgi:hypothetical protein
VAVKFFKRGPHYEGAVQREQYILETLGADPKNNIGEFDELDQKTFEGTERNYFSSKSLMVSYLLGVALHSC